MINPPTDKQHVFKNRWWNIIQFKENDIRWISQKGLSEYQIKYTRLLRKIS